MRLQLTNVCFSILTCMVTWTALAQEQTPSNAGGKNAPSAAQNASTADARSKVAMHVRASKLTGMNIQNLEGKNVGQINDLVIDADTGRISYAAVTYGGFLGIGNKMFAVPFEAFEFRAARNELNERVLVLNVTQSQLEGSVGFDEKNWPNFADKNFVNDLDRRYNIKRDGTGKVQINVDRIGVDINVEGAKRETERPETTPRP